MADDDRYFDVDGLADYSGLSPATLRRFMADPANPLPNHVVARTGRGRGRVLISKREFDAWVKAFPPLHAVAADRPTGRPMSDRVAAAVKSMRGR